MFKATNLTHKKLANNAYQQSERKYGKTWYVNVKYEADKREAILYTLENNYY